MNNNGYVCRTQYVWQHLTISITASNLPQKHILWFQVMRESCVKFVWKVEILIFKNIYMGVGASIITGYVTAQKHVQVHEENIKIPHYCPFARPSVNGGFTKGPSFRNRSHGMTSSCACDIHPATVTQKAATGHPYTWSIWLMWLCGII